MLAVSALRESAIKDDKQKEGEMEMDNNAGFPDFLDSIDFDDLFLGIDVLPDLLPDLSSSDGVEKPSDDDHHSSSSNNTNNNNNKLTITTNKEGDNSRRKTTSQGGKRKVKVDWTPELHRRFVQAVEQLGVDKAVPSRILEIMGIDCLTRHNIASHLQKYRSHRKHLLAREAEAATWSQRRPVAPISSTATTTTTTMGFPHHHHHHMPPMIHFMRPPPHPLHVWGHPSTDQHLRLCPPPSTYNSYSWQRMQVPPHNNNGAAGFGLGLGGLGGLGFPVQSAVSFVPSKESIDAAIGDVLNKPWLPLPLGLKPPSTDSVLCELQRQGVPNVPHSSASA